MIVTIKKSFKDSFQFYLSIMRDDKILFLTDSDVRYLEEEVNGFEVARSALRDLGINRARNAPRLWLSTGSGGIYRALMASSDTLSVVGLKQGLWSAGEIAGKPKTVERNTELVTLVSEKEGRILSIINSPRMNEVRTSSVTTVATDLLSNRDSSSITVLGTGPFSKALILDTVKIRDIELVYVFARNMEKMLKFSNEVGKEIELEIHPIKELKEGSLKSDIILEATYASEPLLGADDLRLGTHISSIGSTFAGRKTFKNSFFRALDLVVTDYKEQILNDKAGDLLEPLAMNIFKLDAILNLSDIIIGKNKGRKSSSDITLFKSLGMGLMDVAFAYAFYRKAVDKGVGSYL
jgi:ornithine cyclodeaminase